MASIGTLLKNVGKVVTAAGESPLALHASKIPSAWPKWAYNITAKALEKEIFIAPNATADPRATLAIRSSVWYGAQVNGASEIGEGSNIQENATLDNVTVGKNVSIGPNARLANCVVEDNAYIGAGAKIESNVKISSLSWVAAGSVVKRDSRVIGGGIWAGNPAVRVRNLTTEEVNYVQQVAKKTSDYAQIHASATGKDEEQLVAEMWDKEEEDARNPLSTYAKNPRMLMAPDRRGMFYDRLDDDDFTGKKTDAI